MMSDSYRKKRMSAGRIIVFVAGIVLWGCSDKRVDVASSVAGSASPNIIIIYTDDQGYADVGYHSIASDIQTPQIDSLAFEGVRMTNGYVTAPQCTPSRAALMTGMYQQRFGVNENKDGPLPLDASTVAEYLQDIGYRTGVVGKWGLGVSAISDAWNDAHITESVANDPVQMQKLRAPYRPWSRGFDECFAGLREQFWATFNPDDGTTFAPRLIKTTEDRLALTSRAAVSFIERNSDSPFFLYVAPYAPHVPLEATEKYLAWFTGDMPERRRYALAMMAAVDDGVGEIVDTLKKQKIYDNTVIIYMSDNGAPLGLDMADIPVSDGSGEWNGSLNTTLNGEKGMLTDGGIRVPLMMHWPKTIPGGVVVDEPVGSLDAIYTALKVAGVSETILAQLDGIDLMPAILGEAAYLNHRPLFWQFTGESAVLLGDWKLLRTSQDDSYLFDMSLPELSVNNATASYPDIAHSLNTLLDEWESSLREPAALNVNETGNYSHYLGNENLQ